MRENPFAEDVEPGLPDCRVEYIYEYWGPHLHGKSYYSDGEDKYDYTAQLDSFKQKLNTFLDEHEIYDVMIEKSDDEHGQVRHEAWILYREDDGE